MASQGFNNSFDKSFQTGMVTGSNAALEAIKEKIKKEAESTEKANKLTALKSAGIQFSEQAISAGADPKVINMFADALSAQKDPDVAEKIYTAAITNAAQQQKDRNDFAQTIQAEKYKAGASAITEVVKSLADKGGYTPAELQAIQIESSNRLASSMGFGQQIIQKASQGQTEQSGSDFFNTPIQPKKTDKQLDREQMMESGKSLINDARNQYNVISEKYGTGRFKGLETRVRGGLGDILPKGKQTPEVAAYEGTIDGLATFVGRNVFNDDRVSEDDRKAYKKSIAGLLNSPEEAKLMFDMLDRFSQSGNTKLGSAIKSVASKDGKGIKPSEAIKGAGLESEFGVQKKSFKNLWS